MKEGLPKGGYSSTQPFSHAPRARGLSRQKSVKGFGVSKYASRICVSLTPLKETACDSTGSKRAATPVKRAATTLSPFTVAHPAIRIGNGRIRADSHLHGAERQQRGRRRAARHRGRVEQASARPDHTVSSGDADGTAAHLDFREVKEEDKAPPQLLPPPSVRTFVPDTPPPATATATAAAVPNGALVPYTGSAMVQPAASTAPLVAAAHPLLGHTSAAHGGAALVSAHGGAALVIPRPAYLLGKQPELGTSTFKGDKDELKGLGAAWGETLKGLPDTPQQVKDNPMQWFVLQGWAAESDAFWHKVSGQAHLLSGRVPGLAQWVRRGSPQGTCYATAADVEKAFARYRPYPATQ